MEGLSDCRRWDSALLEVGYEPFDFVPDAVELSEEGIGRCAVGVPVRAGREQRC